VVGIENAIVQCKIQDRRDERMLNEYGTERILDEREDTVLVTREACDYLRISRPTYIKYLYTGKIKGTKAGKGWRVLKSELIRFLKGGNEN